MKHSNRRYAAACLISLVWAIQAPVVLAQGDTCQTPVAIQATGTVTQFDFDTTLLTTSGFQGGAPCGPGASSLALDGFWEFTVPSPGLWSASLISSFDAEISAFQGNGCSAVCLDHSGDHWYGSVVLEDLVVGDTILFQIGSSGNSQGVGTMTLRHYPDPCDTQSEDPLEDNDSCQSPAPILPGTYLDLLVQPTDRDYYSIDVPPGQLLRVTTLFATSELVLEARGSDCLLLPPSVRRNLISDYGGYEVINRDTTPLTVIIGAISTFIEGPIPQSTLEVCASYDLLVELEPDPCLGLLDDALEDDDTCATATAITDGYYPNLVLNRLDPRDCFAFDVADGQTVAIHMNMEGDSPVRAGQGHGSCTNKAILCVEWGSPRPMHWQPSPFSEMQWTNTTGRRPRALCSRSPGIPDFYAGAPCEIRYDLSLVGSGLGATGIGEPYCAMGTPNSSGQPAVLLGSTTSAGSGLHLEVTSGPPGQLGYLLVGTHSVDFGYQPLGNGLLCLRTGIGMEIGRYNVPSLGRNSVGQFDGNGVLQNLVGTSTSGSGFDVPMTLPFTGDPTILAGETFYFQAWFRDNTAGSGQSHASNGLAFTF